MAMPRIRRWRALLSIASRPRRRSYSQGGTLPADVVKRLADRLPGQKGSLGALNQATHLVQAPDAGQRGPGTQPVARRALKKFRSNRE
jgi:hypothetical protein